MLLLEFLTLVLTIPLAYLYLSTISIRFTFLVFLPGALLSEILGGLFQLTLFLQSPFILGGLSFIEEPNFLLSLIPIVVYSNAETPTGVSAPGGQKLINLKFYLITRIKLVYITGLTRNLVKSISALPWIYLDDSIVIILFQN